ncbi:MULTISPECIES: FAD-dependent oxidoreductase [unclassified Synechocystis]|uniref:FAD-dependent oxidoreductase n=1 Tax=unclassified Synechocystis TaxID=2640012 RepID=UPI000416B2A8|nr:MULTISPECIES: FAD-dependent oxidoreductase [unclassified Synechocystis]AIE75587.1 hypothetical protein D082_30590 [Synechocystis sp. PCC 6714]MCT0253787.1 FAD-dependent oxidoreductase [Synechocystis sp. CS-94]
MAQLSAAAIDRVDVAVIGGGIAGVAIAEYLARHTNLSLQLLEQHSHLGGDSSGKLEGWFHTGALYSGQDDGQTFFNCVNGVEDLLNHYSNYFTERCNLTLGRFDRGYRPMVSGAGWFDPNPVYLIHPQQHCPEMLQSGLKGDRVQLEMQLKRVLGRLEMAYGQQFDWQSPMGNGAMAPDYGHLESYEQRGCSLLSQSEKISYYCRQFDLSHGIEPSNYALLKSLDCAMDTQGILQDLTASALAHGTAIATGINIEQINVDRYGPVRVQSIFYRDHRGQQHYLKAKAFIFAVGAGFESILPTLQVRAKLKRSRSTMVVAYPAVSPHNFVRMSTKNSYHFNHFSQRANISALEQCFNYSMLANSGYVSDEHGYLANGEIELLLDSAERYFGEENLYQRQLWSYDCVKTEFISDDAQKRRYSYWIEANPQSNYLCVLPGKFSFFPTVAVQTLKQLKSILPVQKVEHQPHDLSSYYGQAQALVASPYPHQLLASYLQNKANF